MSKTMLDILLELLEVVDDDIFTDAEEYTERVASAEALIAEARAKQLKNLEIFYNL